MKALIVEDELLARVGMRSLIDWEALGITLLEDAQDGREALERLEKEHPDIMLLDLNIPEISGLELLEIIRKRRINVKTVVVSCYDDFKRVKTAMKLGAVDYIRKFGLSREELTAALANLTENPAEVLPELPKSVAQIGQESRQRIQNIPEEYWKGCCVSFYMLWKYAEEMGDMKIVEAIAAQYYQKLGRQFLCLSYEGKLLFLMKEQSSREEAAALLKQIAPFVSNRCFIGITPYEYEGKDYKFFIRIANSIEAYGFYDSSDEILVFRDALPIRLQLPFDEASCMERLERGIQKMSREDIMEVLEELFGRIAADSYVSVNLVKKLMIEILSRFSDKAGQLGGAIEEIEAGGSYKHYQRIIYMTSFEDMRRWWTEFVSEFTMQFFTRQKCSESDIIQSALDYIEENLDKTIQLSDVARHIGVSEPYLSSYFKRNMNENFIPYVNRQKIRRAKQLLGEGKMVYQVADLLGYENNTYFSKVFKKMEGMTPDEYRRRMLS
ncbi:MAG TPA: response regulator [Candidatus Ventrimonas merdavium]|nr:response regulator [Candidatus Ventrimonas merdavium]